MSDDKVSAKIPHFDGLHYDHWSELMENLLRAKGLWSLVENGFEEPRAGTILTDTQQEQLENTRMKDHKAHLQNCLGLAEEKVWRDDLVKKSLLNSLRRDFEVLAMKETETITEYFAKVMAIANKMRSNGEEMPDSKVVEKVLRTLTERFTYVVVSIEESKDTSSMSIDELQSSLVVHEQKFKRTSIEVDQVLKVESSSRGRGRGLIRGRGRGRGRQTFNRATIECFKCHNLGHFQYECPKWNKEANYAQLNE
ncbi:uncharacterized protein LOC109846843 [Asparagus officinalis]|uniref:uncharacterized protein LOC109846843 n=1 Tax=Asparagus officinalis TaxID=4686 RepID=UPI00098E7C4C|nr:uncharacterized protein LOC109846843 [Asparagus officinalis]